MTYRDRSGCVLDLSSAGRGLQQTLLLLAHLYINPKTVLLLDEPDAHLEVLRQRQIYQLLTDVASQHGSQVIAASHSEIMRTRVAEVTDALATLGRPSPWSDDIKASDEFLNPVFERFFKKLGLPNLLRKTDYHVLAGLVPKDKLAPEVVAKLDTILNVAKKAKSHGE
jgi:predicted regulator of amino acid metabolism with ACT domain